MNAQAMVKTKCHGTLKLEVLGRGIAWYAHYLRTFVKEESAKVDGVGRP